MSTENCAVREDGRTEEQIAHERAVRERILDVVHDLRHDGKPISLEAIVQKDLEQQEAFEKRRFWYEKWGKPSLENEAAAITEIIPTLMDLTGCLTDDARIVGWLSLYDLDLKGGCSCSFAGMDAGRVVWRFRACGKPAVFMGTEGVIHYVGMTPRERIRLSWVGACEDHVQHTDEGHHLVAFHPDDHKKDSAP